MKTYLACCCVATFALAGTTFAAPDSGSSGPKGQQSHPSNVQSKRTKSSTVSSPKLPASKSASTKSLSKNSATKSSSPSSPKKIDSAFKLTKFSNPNAVPNYNLKYGKSFAFGTYYQGKNHHQWTSYGWSSRYRCYLYWDPSTSAYYYWSDANQAFYPVSYADTVAPTPNMPLIDNDGTDSPEAPMTAAASSPMRASFGLPEPPPE